MGDLKFVLNIRRDATFVQRMTYLLWIAHKLAEMATHVADICQRVIFIVEGHYIQLFKSLTQTLIIISLSIYCI